MSLPISSARIGDDGRAEFTTERGQFFTFGAIRDVSVHMDNVITAEGARDDSTARIDHVTVQVSFKAVRDPNGQIWQYKTTAPIENKES